MLQVRKSLQFFLLWAAFALVVSGCTVKLRTGFKNLSLSAVSLHAPTQLVFSVQPTDTMASSTINSIGGIQVTVEDGFGAPVTTSTANVTLSVSSGPGTLSGTVTKTAFNGVATFSDLSIDQVSTGYILRASSTALVAATSASFDISPLQILSITGHVACAVLSGDASCWGENSAGQIGDGTTNDALVPTQVSGLTTGVTAISAGQYMSCAIVSGGVKCWGTGGSLGDGTSNQSSVPVQVVGITSGATAISSGSYHSCAVVSGAAYCWGNNADGELGDGTTNSATSPVSVVGLTSGVTAIATDDTAAFGSGHSCAIMNGDVWCWGYNNYGSLGNGTTTDSHVPVKVIGLPGPATQIASGSSHVCVLVGQSIWCWGGNNGGQLGNNTMTDSDVPVEVVGLSSGITQITTGSSNTCAIVNGAAFCWGDNSYGELGDGLTGGGTSMATPVQVTGLTSGVTSIAGGFQFICAIGSGAAQCWGENASGDIGNNTSTNVQYLTPNPVVDWP